MGGKGSGGRRPGSGRKPLTDNERAVTGNAGHRGRVLAHPSAAAAEPKSPAPVEQVDVPKHLSKEEREIWNELAPFAIGNGTLVKSTVYSFAILCRNIVLERAMSTGLDRGGPNHRGMIQRVDAELLRFNLSACGKPMYRTVDPKPATSAPPVNPLARFLKR